MSFQLVLLFTEHKSLFRDPYIASLLSFSAVRFVVFSVAHWFPSFSLWLSYYRNFLVSADITAQASWKSQWCKPSGKWSYMSHWTEADWQFPPGSSLIVFTDFEPCTKVLGLENNWRNDVVGLSHYRVQEVEVWHITAVDIWVLCHVAHAFFQKLLLFSFGRWELVSPGCKHS